MADVDVFYSALILCLLPAAGYLLGGAIAEGISVSKRALSMALHGTAGIIVSIVSVELLPLILQEEHAAITITFMAMGGIGFLALDSVTSHVSYRVGGRTGEGPGGPWPLYVGVALELFTDGLLIGTGTILSMSLALVLAIGQMISNIPEGLATMISFRSFGTNKRSREVILMTLALPIFLGVTLGYWGLRGQPEIYQLCIIAFAAGLLLTLIAEEIVPEAHRGERDSRINVLILIGSFFLFNLASLYIG
jgi:ZIP family zinc transporter